MKDRVREAVFNILGAEVEGKHAVDLFAGTGALALEAISRGAGRATLIELYGPTAAVLRKNVDRLGVATLCRVVTADVFRWWRGRPSLGEIPWLVFCSPPYAFYVDRRDEMVELVAGMMASAPPGSVWVVEADKRFDFGLLPDAARWDLRRYPPAQIGIYHKPLTTAAIQ